MIRGFSSFALTEKLTLNLADSFVNTSISFFVLSRLFFFNTASKEIEQKWKKMTD